MKTIKIILLSMLVYLLATAVVLSSVHARDLVAHRNDVQSFDVARTTKTHVDDVSAKAIADLHNHVDKAGLKTFNKLATDQIVLVRHRQTQAEHQDTSRPLSVVIMEALLMFRLTYAFALAR